MPDPPTASDLADKELTGGCLKGLLFGDPQRLLSDLVMQLRFQAALTALCTASEYKRSLRRPLAAFVDAAEIWQKAHGYQCL